MTPPNHRKNNGGNASKSKKASVTGRLFVVSAPSGAGKSSLCRAVLERIAGLKYSVSHTTRNPRGNEEDGIDYHFISRDEFLSGIRNGVWAEWAQVHGNYYGTSADFIDAELNTGNDVLLDIDVQGARQIVARYPDSVTIFIMPPSLEALRERLVNRGTDSPEIIEERLRNAETEMAQKGVYRHIIVNDRLIDAVAALSAIIMAGRADAAEAVP